MTRSRENDVKSTILANPRFLITQANSFFNKGEAAIGISLVQTIRNIYPKAHIDFLSSDPNEAQKDLSKYGVNSYDRLLNKQKRRYKGKKKLFYLAQLAWEGVSLLLDPNGKFLSKKDSSIIELFKKSDIVIIGGGGMFGGNKLRSISGNLLPIIISKRFGKKVMVYAPSIEPFTSAIVRIATKYAFNRADVITVREKYSVDLLRKLAISPRICLTADPAFLIGHEPLEKGRALLRKAGVPQDERLRIGMTVRDWDFPGERDSRLKQIHYQQAIKSAIERISRDTNAIIVLFTTSINAPYDDDRVISNEVRESLSNQVRDSVYVLTEDYTPEETKAMIGTMDAFVSTRTHSAIFSLSMNVPTVHIACEFNKNHGIIESLGLKDLILDASTITASELVEKMRQLINERNILAQQLMRKLPVIKHNSMLNGKILRALLEGRPIEDDIWTEEAPQEEIISKV